MAALSATPVQPPEPEPYVDAATLDAVDRWLDYRVWHSRVPGAQVAIGVRGDVLFRRSYGYADLEQQVRLRDDHLFRIASHSKTFAATLVLQLVEQGRLGVDDAIGRHLPLVAGDPELAGIRVRELLEHTGGVLRDGLNADYWQFERPFPDAAGLLGLLREGGSKAAPGAQFAYSNLGYSLLGLLVEELTGLPFARAAAERILEPLGLTDTAADHLPERSGDYAAGHTGLLTDRTHHRLQHIPTGAMAAATGFTSTATDLVRYFAAHAFGDERLLSDRTKRLQQRAANRTDPTEADAPRYGWGMILDTVDGQELVGHSGGYPGHITKTFVDPGHGLVVSVLTNAIDGPAAPLARGVVQLLARARTHLREAGEPPSEAALARTGRYAGLWGVLDVAALGGRLMTLQPAGWAPLEGADELEDAGDGSFRIAAGSGFGSVGELVTFETADGVVTGLRHGGMSMRRFDTLPD